MNQQFTQDHHNIYNALKNTLAGFAHQGIPGMKDILNMVDKTHQQFGRQVKGAATPAPSPATQQPRVQPQIQQPLPQQGMLARSNPGLVQDINALQGQPIVSTPSPAVQGPNTPSPWLMQFLQALQGGGRQR